MRSIYLTLLSHTAEHYPTLPVMRENFCNAQVLYNEQGRPSTYNQVHVHNFYMVPMKLLNDESEVSSY